MASRAPRFQWKRDPAGRVALLAILQVSYQLNYTDDVICFSGELPSSAELEEGFLRVLPWFPAYYDQTRAERAVRTGYLGRLEPFSAADLRDRLAYMFYRGGISDEHPKSTEQAKPGKLRETWIAVSELVHARVREGKMITPEEAQQWGRSLRSC